MNPRYVFTSLTRISDLAERPFEVEAVARSRWRTGDYVVAEVVYGRGPLAHVELANGRMAEVVDGDLIVGVLGSRAATLEVVGSWRDVGDDLRMECLTSAGLLGKATSVSAQLPNLLAVRYLGHVVRGGERRNMTDDAPAPPPRPLEAPVVLLVGTSMSSGKTTTAKIVVRLLKTAGWRVVGAKLTGAGRYRDILSMADAGADAICDFVDAGLPSTVCRDREFRPLLDHLLARVAAVEPQVVVAEAGASPLEPYNGAEVLDAIGEHRKCTILCASDPYAVVGVMQGFQLQPDLVTGVAASTSAGIELLERLTGLPAVNVLDPTSWPTIGRILERCLGPAPTPQQPTGRSVKEA